MLFAFNPLALAKTISGKCLSIYTGMESLRTKRLQTPAMQVTYWMDEAIDRNSKTLSKL